MERFERCINKYGRAKYSIEDIFKIDPHRKTKRNPLVRKVAIELKLIKYECAICGQKPLWQGKPLKLILDHINGIGFDDRLENLRFVCPNCNYQLDTTWNMKREEDELEEGEPRLCSSCSTYKYPEDFLRSHTSADGLSQVCRDCKRKIDEDTRTIEIDLSETDLTVDPEDERIDSRNVIFYKWKNDEDQVIWPKVYDEYSW